QVQETKSREQAQQPANPANAPVVFRLRDEIVNADIAAGKRVLLDAPAVDGSISLEGARIDDISLKGFYDTIDAKQKKDTTQEVQLLSPNGTDRAFYAVVAWTSGSGFSTNDAMWTQTNQGQLTPDNPLKLTYTGAAARIDRIITIDADYMFTI